MKKAIIITAILTAAILLMYSSIFIVRSDQYGVISRFGKVTKTIEKGGLYLKLPYPIEQVYRINRKIKIYEPTPLEVFLPDEQNVVKNITVGYCEEGC